MNQAPREITFADLEFKMQTTAKPGRDGNSYWSLIAAYLRGHAVTAMLDEWVGPLNWKSHFETMDLNGAEVVRCYISVHDGAEWITKEDVGAYPTAHGDDGAGNSRKGGISDSLKRCASRQWGVGRRVYDLRPVYAPVDGWTDNNGKVRAKISAATLAHLRRHYQAEAAWLKGEPALDVIGDEDTTTTAPSPPETPKTQKRADTRQTGTKAQNRNTAPEVDKLSLAVMSMTGADATRVRDALEAAQLWPVRDIDPDGYEAAWAIINNEPVNA